MAMGDDCRVVRERGVGGTILLVTVTVLMGGSNDGCLLADGDDNGATVPTLCLYC